MDEQEDVTGRGSQKQRIPEWVGEWLWWEQENKKGPRMTRSDVVLRPASTEEPSAESDGTGLLLQQNILV